MSPQRHAIPLRSIDREVALLTHKISWRKRWGLDWTSANLRSRLAYLLSDEGFCGRENTLLVLRANHVRNGW